MKVKRTILWAAFIVPLQQSPNWTELKFSKIPANKVSFTGSEVKIEVNKSASPLIYKIEKPTSVVGFTAELSIDGKLSLSDEGKTFEEDSYMRFGFVAQGTHTLSVFKRMFVADWVKKLFDLSPAGVGLDKIYFYNVAASRFLVGKKRLHPASDYMFEEVVSSREVDQKDMTVVGRFDTPKKILAVWLSSDGDDSKSEFKVVIRKLGLNTGEDAISN